MKTAAEVMSKYWPCDEAVEWMADRTLQAAWGQCPRGDWLLWAADHLGVDRSLLVLAACDCAETALKFVHAGDERPRRAVETARRWAAGEATLEEVKAAASAADAAAVAYAAARASVAAAYAADAAARASAAAAYAADASAHAAYAAARASAAAAAHASAHAAYAAALRQMADLVRARIPWAVVEPLLTSKETP
jgi:hypothetical protein